VFVAGTSARALHRGCLKTHQQSGNRNAYYAYFRDSKM
jgi:hypothetical protein